MILLEQKTHPSTARWFKYHTVLLGIPNITVKRCTVRNPASLLPTVDDRQAHDCVAAITEVCSPSLDLQETPLPHADVELFVDGSASGRPKTGKTQAGFAVVAQFKTKIAQPLPSNFSSAPTAELKALTEACKGQDC